jgi:hypothetical protein
MKVLTIRTIIALFIVGIGIGVLRRGCQWTRSVPPPVDEQTPSDAPGHTTATPRWNGLRS